MYSVARSGSECLGLGCLLKNALYLANVCYLGARVANKNPAPRTLGNKKPALGGLFAVLVTLSENVWEVVPEQYRA